MSVAFRPESFDALVIDGHDWADGRLNMRYTLRGPDPVTFTEVIDFGDSLAGGQPDPLLVRLLTLTCSLSYFKAAAPGRIEIAFPTHDFEKNYLSALIEGGLGEFAYRNQLPGALTPEIAGPSSADEPCPDDDWDPAATPLVPVGGGKDSVVSIEAFRRHGIAPMLFSVNRYDPIDRCIEVSGLNSVHVRRSIDRGLIAANADGAYNGHVPVTAINSVIGLIVADAHRLGPVVLSNERSSNVGNIEWLGRDINHQWSKSLVYESLLRDTLARYGFNPDRYFSLLRGLSESQIADRFATSAEYFGVFTSCNRLFALDPSRRASSWCGICPKCQFVFVLLAPRLGRATLEKIFGHNLFADTGNRDGFADILGLGVHKPFECVGEYYEAAESMLAVIDDPQWQGLELVDEFASQRAQLAAVAVNPDPSPAEHHVPDRYAKLIDD
jgi:UDP-N-acetyl-alpha-D-muramoyl-L-alanyl-L-glutamate epimerase